MLGAFLAQRAAARGFEAINRRDVEAVMRSMADDAVLIVPSRTVMGGRFEGKAAIAAWYDRWMHRMSRIRFTVLDVGVCNLRALGPTNTVMVEWELDEADTSGHAYRFTGVTVLDVVEGKVVRQQEYIFEQDLMREVWPKA
jgi:ketosteroid isomerase-like protein